MTNKLTCGPETGSCQWYVHGVQQSHPRCHPQHRHHSDRNPESRYLPHEHAAEPSAQWLNTAFVWYQSDVECKSASLLWILATALCRRHHRPSRYNGDHWCQWYSCTMSAMGNWCHRKCRVYNELSWWFSRNSLVCLETCRPAVRIHLSL